MKVLELFCGTKSISKAFEKAGHETYTVDWNAEFNPTLKVDISTITKEQILELCGGYPDVIWVSPDCTSYSIAAISHHRVREPNGNLAPKSEYAKFCDATNTHVISLLKELNPKYWFIENPRGGMRKMDFMKDFTRYTVTYCQYGDKIVQELIFNMKTKKCPKCGKTKDIGEFYKCKSRRDGFTSWCKDCSNKSHKKYAKNSIDHLQEYGRKRYAENPEKFRETRKKSNEKNAESIKKARLLNYKENKDKILENDKKYYEENKTEILKRNRQYYLDNTEYFKVKARNRKKRVKEIGDGSVTLEHLNKMYEDQNHKCDYCGCDLDLEENKKNLDHILPISRGGKHTMQNVHWICQKCNMSKKDKTEEEWLKKERMKPTDIWTNHNDPKFKPMCHNGDPCHESAPRGSKTGTQGLAGAKERSRIPTLLCEHIVKISEEEKTDDKQPTVFFNI